MIATDLSKQQALDADPKAIQQIISKSKSKENLNRGLNLDANIKMFFIVEERKETILDFSQEIVRVL